MTLDELRARIEALDAENSEAWEMCGNIVDLPYYDGFGAACQRILDLLDEGGE